MVYAEFRRHLGKAGMTVNDFAAYLCIRPASVSNYSKLGSVPQAYAIIAILLGEAADRGVNIAQLLGKFGVAPRVLPTGSNVKQFDMFRAAQTPLASREGRKSQTGVSKDSGVRPSTTGNNQSGSRL